MSYMKTVNGVDYISTDETEVCSCDGCAALGDSRLCDQLNDYPEKDYIGMCLDLNIIWLTKEEEKQS